MQYQGSGEEQEVAKSSQKPTENAETDDYKIERENACKKYETRRSNGISCPSQKYLENDQVMYYEVSGEKALQLANTKDDQTHGTVAPISETLEQTQSIADNPPLRTETQHNVSRDTLNSISHEVQNNGSRDVQDNMSRDVQNIVSRDFPYNGGHIAAKKIKEEHFDNNTLPTLLYKPRENAADFIKSLYASDYQNGETNFNYYESDSTFEPHPRERSRLARLSKSEWRNTFSKSLPENVSEKYYSGKFYYGKTCSNKTNIDDNNEFKEEDRRQFIERKTRECNSQKWRHWKSGLSDDQLQRRRQSNREAQRRRRMRLKMIQMKSPQDGVKDDDVLYKRYPTHDDASDLFKPFAIPKTRLEDILEKRQRVFLDAQLEKTRNQAKKQAEFPAQNGAKSRGCRIKVTPQRQVIVPSMSYIHEMERSMSQSYFDDEAMCSDESETSPVEYFQDLSTMQTQDIQHGKIFFRG